MNSLNVYIFSHGIYLSGIFINTVDKISLDPIIVIL